VEGLVARLKQEGEVLATQNPGYELFVIIDNYDDLSEELERSRDVPKELATLARRYGRDGMHFIIGGTLDSGISDLRRRVQASNYGVGLRNAQSTETLRVSRTPPEVRTKELVMGRGFIIKSGQATMIQTASPYVGRDTAPVESEEEEERRAALALDRWVEKITAKYPDQRADWAVPVDGTEPLPAGMSPPNEKVMRLLELLRLGMRKELARLEEGNGDADLITARLVELDMTRWMHEGTLMGLLKEVWKKEKRASGLPDDMVEMTFSVMDDESILLDIENALAPAEEEEEVES
jgi:hypothetical protein